MGDDRGDARWQPPAGPHEPRQRTATRVAGSVRRTSSIDTHRPNGFAANAAVEGRARDLWTHEDGSCEVLAEVVLTAEIEPMRTLVALQVEPAVAGLDALLGSAVGGGFRARLARAVGSVADDGSLAGLLLDDLIGATLVSGYAAQRAFPMTAESMSDDVRTRVLDNSGVCAGWAEGGSIMVSLRGHGAVPTPYGPPAPLLEADDPDGWHELSGLTPGAMRRRRCLDVLPASSRSAVRAFRSHFRDSHVSDTGLETVVHEYEVDGTVDAASQTVGALQVRARVLPWVECPTAVASAQQVVGAPVAELRRFVRANLSGVSTCTHLNDVLRTLADLDVLLDSPMGEARV